MKYFHLVSKKMGRKKSNTHHTIKCKEQFTVQATPLEISFLSKLLPKGYRFQKLGVKNKSHSQQLKKLGNCDQLQTCEELPKTRSSHRLKNKLSLSVQSQRRSSIQYLEEVQESEFLDYDFCADILLELKKHHSSWPFQYPVDAEELGVPQYFQIVTEPMDLFTIETKLRQGQYLHDSEFQADIRKIITNSYNFNEGNIQYIKPTQAFEKYFEKLISKYEKRRKNANNKSSLSQIQTKGLTLMQKKILGKQIKNLSRKQRESVMKMAYGNQYKDMILDINQLQVSKLRSIQKLVDKMSPQAQFQEQESVSRQESSFCTQSQQCQQ